MFLEARRGRIGWVRWLGCLMAAALVLAGCGGGGDSGSDNTYSVGLTEPEHLTPGNSNESYGITVIRALFDRLVRYDPKTGEPIPNQAKSIESDDDNKVWTITLKPGLKFHNGQPVTARSYVRAWNYTAYGPHGFANNYFFENIEGYDALNPEDPDGDKGPKKAPKPEATKLSGLQVTGRLTFEVTLSKSLSQFPLMLGYTGFAPLPKVFYSDPKAFDAKPIGTGPFMMDGKWEHNERIKLEAFPGYKGPRKPKADGLTFKIYANPQTAYNDLIAGDVDIMFTVPASKVKDARRQFGERFIDRPSDIADFLAFPLYDERFANPKLRYAISMAINRKAIVNAVYNGAYKPMNSLMTPIVPGARKNACGEHCRYNPRKAKKLFKEAGGWQGTMTLWHSSSDPSYRAWMEAVANQLRRVLGIKKIQIKSLPAAQWFDMLEAHKATGPYRANWIMDYPSPQNALEPLYSTNGSSNRTGYSNERVDELIEKGNSAPSLEKSIPYYHQAEDLILKDMPVTPLWNWRRQAAYSEDVTNVTIDPYAGLHTAEVTVVG